LASKKTTDAMLEMVNYLRDHPGLHKITDLAERYKTNRTAIDRWCKALEKRYGIVVEKTNADFVEKTEKETYIPRGYVKLSSDAPEVLNIALDTIELEALMIAAERIKPLTPVIERAISKLSKARRIKNYKKKAPVLHVPLYDEYATDPGLILERVIEAIRDHQIAEVRYHNAKNQLTSYKFNSYALVPFQQHLHLLGVTHPGLEAGNTTPVRLRLDQIIEFKLIQDHFDDPDFDAAAFINQDFGAFRGTGEPQRIKVRFSAEKAQFIRRTKRHETQKVKTNDSDGSVIWSISAPVTEDLVYWIVSYGPHARVLEPAALREQVVEWAKGSMDANA
jgi:predicted DNA-binding transcriptional regulator YafY